MGIFRSIRILSLILTPPCSMSCDMKPLREQSLPPACTLFAFSPTHWRLGSAELRSMHPGWASTASLQNQACLNLQQIEEIVCACFNSRFKPKCAAVLCYVCSLLCEPIFEKDLWVAEHRIGPRTFTLAETALQVSTYRNYLRTFSLVRLGYTLRKSNFISRL